MFLLHLCRRSSIFLPASGEGEDVIEDFEPATTLRLFIKYVNSLIVVALEVGVAVRVQRKW